MGVYVKGMKMPQTCKECPCWWIDGEGYIPSCCQAGSEYEEEPKHKIEQTTLPDDCPLVEVQIPHGDLIDRQKLLEDNKHLEYPTNELYRRYRAWTVGFNSGASHCNEHAVYAKTVIEAEGE